jgi:hypothetical protein
MNIKDNQKSHKQLPKFMMKQFSVEKIEKERTRYYTWCYAFKTLRYELSNSYYMEIRENECSPASIDSLGTKRGYFNDKSEIVLNINAENEMKELIKKLDINKKNEKKIIEILNVDKNFNNIKNFICYTLLRQEDALKEIHNLTDKTNKISQIFEKIGEYENKKMDSKEIYNKVNSLDNAKKMEYLKKAGISKNDFKQELKFVNSDQSLVDTAGKLNITFIYNNTELNFMTNSIGYSYLIINNDVLNPLYFIPLNPKILLMIRFNKLNQEVSYKQENFEYNIKKINEHIIEDEIKNNNNFIIAKEKIDLIENLKLFYKSFIKP